MSADETPNPRLSHLATPWTFLGQAHSPDADSRLAQAQVLFHYRPALHQYLTRLVGEPDLAEDLCQEFALRFLRGDFRHVRPERGRFRDYVKAALRNLVSDYHRRRPPVAEPSGKKRNAATRAQDADCARAIGCTPAPKSFSRVA